jgi:membrane protein required for colicin V production
MTALDIALLAIVGVCVILGLIKGFVRRVGSLIGVLLGVILAFRFGALAGEYIRPAISSDQVRGILAPFLVFLGVYLVVALLSSTLHKLIHAARLGCLDRLGGAALGAVTAAIPLGALLLLAVAYVPVMRPPIAESRVAVFMMNGSRALLGLLPEQAKAAFQRGKKEVDELIQKYKTLPRERLRDVEQELEEV